MILTTREATEKDRSLKTLLLIQTGNCSEEKISGEKVWKRDGFFCDVRPGLNLE